MRKLRLPAAAVGVAVVAMSAGMAAPAFAGHVKTFVVVTYNNATPPNPITVTNVAPNAVVTVSLDSTTCLQAFNNKSFGLVASDDNASAVTVQPAFYSGLFCGDSRTFTLTGIANGGATIKFNVDAPPGLEGQTSGAQVNVSSSGFSTNGGGNPPGHDRPAAPAVTNGFLNSDAQTSACMAAYDNAKNWHGQLIRSVAKWAATNHLGQAKDDTTRFPLDTDWIAYVQTEVNTLCS